MIGLLKIGFLLGAVGFLTFFLKSNPQVAFVNLHDAMAKPAKLLSLSQFSEVEQKEIMKRYSRQLFPVIQRYAKDHQKTVIDAKSIADAAEIEITDDIVRLTLEAIKHDQ